MTISVEEPIVFVVLDSSGAPEFVCLWEEKCHEYINDAIMFDENNETDAREWVVRKYCPVRVYKLS